MTSSILTSCAALATHERAGVLSTRQPDDTVELACGSRVPGGLMDDSIRHDLDECDDHASKPSVTDAVSLSRS